MHVTSINHNSFPPFSLQSQSIKFMNIHTYIIIPYVLYTWHYDVNPRYGVGVVRRVNPQLDFVLRTPYLVYILYICLSYIIIIIISIIIRSALP